MNKKNIFIGAAIIITIIGMGYLIYRPVEEKPFYTVNIPVKKLPIDPKDATYIIDGKKVTLLGGRAEKEIAPGSASKIITQYFGNEVKGDFNADGTEDTAFILTQDTGGSGTFFYVVAALKLKGGYYGTNAVLLGDRIAPQTTEFRNREIIVNYAERKPGEPMTTRPSMGVSKYLKVEGAKLVEIPPGGVSNNVEQGVMGKISLGPTCPVQRIPPDPNCADKPYKTTVQVIAIGSLKSSPFAVAETDSDGRYKIFLPAGEYALQPRGGSPLPRCETKNITVTPGVFTEADLSCDTGIR